MLYLTEYGGCQGRTPPLHTLQSPVARRTAAGRRKIQLQRTAILTVLGVRHRHRVPGVMCTMMITCVRSAVKARESKVQ